MREEGREGGRGGMTVTVVPVTAGPLGERPPALAGHFCDVPTTCHVKVPASNGHLPNAASGQQNVGFYPC